jgi:serine/threonine protein kinase
MDALFKGTNEQDQLNKIVAVLGTPPASWEAGHKLAKKIGFHFGQYSKVPMESIIRNASPEGIDLLNQMLEYDHAKRPSASQILGHPYFARSMKSGGGGEQKVWGETSMRENYAKKKSIVHKYQNPQEKVINIQNNTSKNKMKLKDLDNDWDEDFEDLMKPTTPYNKFSQGRGGANQPEEGSLAHNNSRSYINNKSEMFMQNSNLNLKNDTQKNLRSEAMWNDNQLDESFEGEFDVFTKKDQAASNPFAMKSNQQSYGGQKMLDDRKAEPSKQFDIGWAEEF